MCVCENCDAGCRLQPSSGTRITYSPVEDRTPLHVPGSGLNQPCAHSWSPKRQILMNQMLPLLHLQGSISRMVGRAVARYAVEIRCIILHRCTGDDPQTCSALASEAATTLLCAWQLLSSKTIVLYPITS